MAYEVQALSGWELERKVSQTAPLVAARHEPRFDVPRTDSYYDYQRVYGEISWVYRCIARIATTAASVPLQAYQRRRKGGAWEEEDASTSEAATVLEAFNGRVTWPDGVEATMSFLLATGNAYWELARWKRNKEPAELWVMRPDRVKVKPDKQRFVGGYTYTVDSRNKVNFEPEDVVHFHTVNLTDDFYGLGPLKAAVNAITMEYYGQAYNRVMLERCGQPQLVVKTDMAQVDPNESRRLKREFQEKFIGPNNAGKAMFLPEGWELTEFGVTPDKLQWDKTRKNTREEIACAFGVPPIMMGLYEGVNFATAQQQEKMFWSATVKPLLDKLAGGMNEQLMWQWKTPEGLRIRFDLSGIDCLQEDKYKETERVLQLVEKRVIIPNEARGMLNIEGETPGGDAHLVPMTLIPLEQAASTVEEAPEKSWDEFEDELAAAEGDNGNRHRSMRRYWDAATQPAG